MPFVTTLDIVALAWFLVAWIGYSWAVDLSPLGRQGLTARMAEERTRWMETMAVREHRIVDTSIMAGLQQGTAFFASSSLFAIGGVLALMRAGDQAEHLARSLPVTVPLSATLWEFKVLGLAVIFVYAFFKFAWAYRLFNYTAILIGAVPSVSENRREDAVRQARKAAQMQTTAAGHFNRGLRAFFFALAYLGYFVSPLLLIATTTGVLFVLYRRQFGSTAVAAVTPD
jgi:uncharacterized membrane protein